ncbi:MAG: FtsX-like permease family protein [Phycisphaerales bacterium]|nr:FtsX-like permease family protein [Phycisphaerales bacterium]
MIRIALRMLLGDTTKFVGVVLGVFFCTFLITHLLSMFTGLMSRTYALVTDIPQADIWVMDPAVEYVDEPAGLPSTSLDRVRSVEGVKWAVPLFSGSLRCRLPSGRFRSVLVIGVDDATLLGAPEHMVEGRVESLRSEDAAIVDLGGARDLLRLPVEAPVRGPGWNMPVLDGPARALEVGDEILVNDRRVVIAGIADLGPRFLSKAILYVPYSRALRMSPPERNLLSFVLVKAAEGEDGRGLAGRIQESTGLRARTAQDFSDDTYEYYFRTTGVVGRIVFMISLGVVVGIAVSALLLFMFTAESAPYYATLKALGASNQRVVAMVLAQAAVCGATGYGLGVGFSCLLGRVIIKSDTMPYLLAGKTLVFTACAVMVVTMFAAVMSAVKVMRLEPAQVFKT